MNPSTLGMKKPWNQSKNNVIVSTGCCLWRKYQHHTHIPSLLNTDVYGGIKQHRLYHIPLKYVVQMRNDTWSFSTLQAEVQYINIIYKDQ
jgi:hypothetical protein